MQDRTIMASELSKLIEDQLQKHDEEAPLSPTEKQRLLSSSLRIKTSPGRKQEKRSPIVKLSKEQPAPLSVSGSSVPVPSGQSWVTEDAQKFKWTKWRIALAVFTVLAILAALLVAFSHPSSKIHHPDVSRFTQGNSTAKPLLGGLLGGGKAKAPKTAPALATAEELSTLEYGSAVPAKEGDLTTAGAAPWDGGSAETLPGAAHHKPHNAQPHQHQHAHQQGAHAGSAQQVTPIASAASRFGAGASAATFASAMRDRAAGALPVPAPAPALALTAAVLPPVSVPTLAPAQGPGVSMLPAAATQLPLAAPGLAGARKPPSQSAGIYTVAGVAGGDPSLGGYPSTEAWDEIHGGAIGTMQQQGVEGVASVAGSPGGVSNETEDDEEWPDEEATEEMEVAGGYPGQSFAEEHDGFGG